MATALTYEERLAHERDRAEWRVGYVQAVFAAVLDTLPASGGWTVTRGKDHDGKDTNILTLSDGTTGRVIVEGYPGGYNRVGRLVFRVPTTRHTEFGPNDWDTVVANGFEKDVEKTFNETRDPKGIAKAVLTLVETAAKVARALDIEQRRLFVERAKGIAVRDEFLRAGWSIHGNSYDPKTARAIVPDGHPLRALGVSDLKIDLTTGSMTYGYTPYLPSDTTPADILSLHDFRLPPISVLKG